MKDINDHSLQLGIQEAEKLLNNQFERGKLSALKMVKILSSIHPSLDYHGSKDVDIVIEAVIENPKIKAAVLAEAEALISPNLLSLQIHQQFQSLNWLMHFSGLKIFVVCTFSIQCIACH